MSGGHNKIKYYARIAPPTGENDKGEVSVFSAIDEIGQTVVAAKSGIKTRLI